MHIHVHIHNDSADEKLNSIIKNQLTIMSQLDDIKAKLDAQNTALDTISGAVAGIQTDIQSLKDKIAELQQGADAAVTAALNELAPMVDGISSKIDTIAATTTDLDAQTP